MGSCILSTRNRPLSVGYNSYKTHPSIIGPQTLHAELRAIINLDYSYCYNHSSRPNLRIVVVRIVRGRDDGSLLPVPVYGMARPCGDCMEIIKKVGIRTVLYTTNNGYAEEKI